MPKFYNHKPKYTNFVKEILRSFENLSRMEAKNDGIKL